MDGGDLPDKGVSEDYKVVKGAKEHVMIELGARQCSAVFVEISEADNVFFAEMFPISSDSVPEEERRKHYKLLSTYADCISRGLSKRCETQSLTMDQHSQYRYLLESLFIKGKKCAAKWRKCLKHRS